MTDNITIQDSLLSVIGGADSNETHINPMRVALPYAAISSVWIVATDMVIGWLFSAHDSFQMAQTIKGLLFVGATTVIVYWLARQAMHKAKLKWMETRLLSIQNFLAKILANLDEAVFVIDPTTRTIVQCNPAAERMFGFKMAELIGQSTEILHVNRQAYEEFAALGMPTLEKEGIFRGAYRMKKKNGSILDTEHTVSTIDESYGWRGGVVSIVHDVTARKFAEEERGKLQAQLMQTQKMEAIGTLAGGIAHDFNNILSAVIGYTELAQIKLEPESEVRDDLKAVLTAGERAKELVRQILAFSRQAQKEKMPVQTGLIVKEALKLIRSSLPTTIEIRQNILSKSVILSDPTEFHQIVMNLCTNAAYAMREKGGILEITLTDVKLDSNFSSTHLEIQPGAYQKLTVSDTGHGIKPEVLNRIFDPFFTTKPKDEGTGLGLSVVHGIVKDCGGTITVYSELDEGSTFNLYFPIIEGKAEEKQGEHVNIPTGIERILVVDDDKAIVDITQKNLTSLGYEVKVRTSSLEALELFKAMPDKFDLVITDMTMSQMTGDHLASEMMKIRPDVPVILCTGFSENITREKSETIGIKAFLVKPLLKQEMAHTIRMVLDQTKASS
ncbi:MAG: ATP-binding protein [Thermodesulfobacteriota bacterium]